MIMGNYISSFRVVDATNCTSKKNAIDNNTSSNSKGSFEDSTVFYNSTLSQHCSELLLYYVIIQSR